MGDLTFDQPGTINALVSASGSYADFANTWEIAHGAPHVAIGGALLTSNFGDMFLVAQSPNDPAFFIAVHANTDRVWWVRQRASGNAQQYDGQHQGRTVSASDRMSAFGRTVADTFSIPCVGYGPGRAVRTSRRFARRARAVALRVAPAARAPAAALQSRWAAASGFSAERQAQAQAQLNAAAVEALVQGRLKL
ncbi:hypothetical protein BU14_0084s0011 [Porphyra umbilicalis]|uniref:Tyrosinase copper-binding domain-containing protein n=1 Tax=Porphyra umbilicalis TaxID=2786 RepID=A0A1X6PEB3_PORUM|nr:hypothetical protein BU14_0084s0011 [Porphyra umbilicalis]|eukprot:OSX79197.1 hypothetical protein BU14_0084s0011 [Porphyra umbilicalis]